MISSEIQHRIIVVRNFRTLDKFRKISDQIIKLSLFKLATRRLNFLQIDNLCCACNNHLPPIQSLTAPTPPPCNKPTNNLPFIKSYYPVYYLVVIYVLFICVVLFIHLAVQLMTSGTVLCTFQAMADHVTHAASILHLRSCPQVPEGGR